MSDLLGITDKTAKKYVDYLCQAFLIQLLTRLLLRVKNVYATKKHTLLILVYKETAIMHWLQKTLVGDWRM